jgi:hypothetical protein
VAWRLTAPDGEQAELEQGLEQLREKKTGHRKPPRFVRPFHSMTPRGPGAGEEESRPVFVPQPQKDPGDLGPDEAIDAFEGVMDELEQAAASGRRLDTYERAELYNRATGSFTALSAWVDGGDASERALMEDAYARMMSLMRELKIQPPPVAPEGQRIRR